ARLRIALGLTLAVLIVELAGGLLSHSLALLSDAGHVLTDVFALGLAWFAVAQARRPADQRRSYGYQRVGLLTALLNSAALIVIVIAIGFEAVRRLLSPQPVEGGVVIATALVAIAINAFVILTLRAQARNLNLRAALLHVTGDVAASASVVVGGVLILLTGWLPIDPLLSLAIAALIAYGAWGILREAVHLLMEGTPRDIDMAAVTKQITSTPRVSGVHDLHVWALSSEEVALSCHIVVGDVSLGDAEHVVRDLEHRLCDRFAIGHTTIQVESCHPCGEIHHGAGEHNHPHEVVLEGRPVDSASQAAEKLGADEHRSERIR
ncbi:MAG TPA: cation diffusion facilitator family transporter, partial [Candidatus Limnocylindrales bacterium]|nr:cation diffusion facilitator family transporter [Candidatus Limnocylindrales bacterium]